ncbi:MAG: protein-glutamate O-methyltransferase, partial [Syntrophaceae bacterium]|nr:protein-glutamate O-methyltransferase [Syntrophaceae bacterium]
KVMSELNDNDFEKISKLVYELCGINLHEGKKELVKARLGKRLREGNYKSFKDYFNYVTTNEGKDELITMIDSISTNLTSFYREESHFARLQSIVSSILEKTGSRDFVPKFNVWSAGCSTGEEPYTIAITIKEVAKMRQLDARIFATDISTRVLQVAQTGIYPEDRIKKIDASILGKYFQMGTGRSRGYFRVKKDIKDMITFERLNLMNQFSPDYNFDVIFCRNVMIYFDKYTQARLVDKYYNSLKKEGYFFVGHSESLTGLTHSFKYIEPSVYQK